MPLTTDTPAGLSIEKGTGQAIEAHREGIMQLPESRVRMEAEALFGYGSAAASLRLLWRYRLLDVLLPQLAKRFTKAKLPRCPCRSHLCCSLCLRVCSALEYKLGSPYVLL